MTDSAHTCVHTKTVIRHLVRDLLSSTCFLSNTKKTNASRIDTWMIIYDFTIAFNTRMNEKWIDEYECAAIIMSRGKLLFYACNTIISILSLKLEYKIPKWNRRNKQSQSTFKCSVLHSHFRFRTVWKYIFGVKKAHLWG